nr:protein transport protein SEC31-like [Aegilops tauschii subsp. strangulata]
MCPPPAATSPGQSRATTSSPLPLLANRALPRHPAAFSTAPHHARPVEPIAGPRGPFAAAVRPRRPRSAAPVCLAPRALLQPRRCSTASRRPSRRSAPAPRLLSALPTTRIAARPRRRRIRGRHAWIRPPPLAGEPPLAGAPWGAAAALPLAPDRIGRRAEEPARGPRPASGPSPAAAQPSSAALPDFLSNWAEAH